jgi:hypothetical protein
MIKTSLNRLYCRLDPLLHGSSRAKSFFCRTLIIKQYSTLEQINQTGIFQEKRYFESGGKAGEFESLQASNFYYPVLTVLDLSTKIYLLALSK